MLNPATVLTTPCTFVVLELIMLQLAAASVMPSITDVKVEELQGIADFRSVRLIWKSHLLTSLDGFQVQWCELVSWGKDKCNIQLVNVSESSASNAIGGANMMIPVQSHETLITGLRLATNYSFMIQPALIGHPSARHASNPSSWFAPRGRGLGGNEIIVATKGYSASPRACLGNQSEIDIETGPYFGGRISIEGALDKRCTWIGDPRDPRYIHTFTIDHNICGGTRKKDRIENIIIVTESRSIITHTARRFMVVCNLLPEAFTIKASIHIPSNTENSRSLNDAENIVDFTMPPKIDRQGFRRSKSTYNKMVASQQSAELSQVAHWFQDSQKEMATAHLALMVILVVAAAVGITGIVWWYFSGTSKSRTFTISKDIEDLDLENTCDCNDGKLVFFSRRQPHGKDDDTESSKSDNLQESGDFHTMENLNCRNTSFVLTPSSNTDSQYSEDSNC